VAVEKSGPVHRIRDPAITCFAYVPGEPTRPGTTKTSLAFVIGETAKRSIRQKDNIGPPHRRYLSNDLSMADRAGHGGLLMYRIGLLMYHRLEQRMKG
jgi:hypothetical protein